MKISDLSKIDVKNLSVDSIKEKILERRDISINVGICVLAFFLLMSSFGKAKEERTHLKAKIQQLEKKEKTVKRLTTAQNGIATLISTSPKAVEEGDIIRIVSEYALKHNVQISSFSPAQLEKTKLFDKINIRFQISAKEYADLVLFMNELEKSPSALAVHEWQGSMGGSPDSRRSRSANESVGESISVSMMITTIKLKDEK